MGELCRFTRRPKAKSQVFFSRQELNQLLSLYSRRVSSGEWRDYAIDHNSGRAIFSVFRHSHDSPLFAIAKQRGKSGPSREFVVFRGHCKIKQSANLSDALSVFHEQLRVVS